MSYCIEFHHYTDYLRGMDYVLLTVEPSANGSYATPQAAYDRVVQLYKNSPNTDISGLRNQIKKLYKSIRK